MLARFEGEGGRTKLIEVLADQKLVQHHEVVARRLAEIVKVEEFPAGKQLYVRGEPGRNVLYFILNGTLDLLVDDESIASLESGQFVGEFPILNSSLDYTVSVVARDRCVVASLTEPQFLALASDYPQLWQNMAKVLATRLRNANTATQRSDTPLALKAADVSIGQVLKSLTVPQVVGIIATMLTILTTVATAAYKLGTKNVLGGL